MGSVNSEEDICYVIMLSPTPQDRRDMDIIRAHVKHLQELERSGQLVMCGPFSDSPGGMVIIRAESREEADRIAQRDPYILTGIRSYELRTWGLSHAGNRHMGIAEE
ncbi:YciI family protein [Paenibacillus graminis]|uniref:YciI family protein n=1 Tax=Paenibacillus graminis TaxID=189425 RepID=UPI002DB909A1|nr:YciI family protein [Paenibacillus graminis]MEC0171790.1 YciI family protein [Paenibacillus graminis]